MLENQYDAALSIEEILTMKQLNEETYSSITEEPLVLLYKHSPICSLSARAHDEVSWFDQQHSDIPVYMVNVLDQRSLSMTIAADTGIQHHSPQVIILRYGKPVWDTSHMRVRAERIEQAINPE